MNVIIKARNFQDTKLINSGVALKPVKYSFNAVGGAKAAEIAASGKYESLIDLLYMLRCDVKIYDDNGDDLWWGLVRSVAVYTGNLKISTSLDGMANRINVLYSTSGPQAGSSQTAETGWSDSAASQTEYGVIEKRTRIGNISDEAALTHRATMLNQIALPFPDVSIEAIYAKEPRAVITCAGWFESLKWRYYSNTSGNASGVESFESGTSESVMYLARGHARSGTSYFVGAEKKLYDTINSLLLGTGNTILMTGTSLNNGIRNTTASYGGGNVTFAETTFDEYSVGTPGSCTYYFLGNGGQKIAQSFALASNNPFYATEVQVKIGKNLHTASVTVSIYSDSASLPGTQLANGTLTASQISTSLGWHKFELNTSVLISYSTTYWIVIEATSSTDGSSYSIACDLALGYSRGAVKVWAGAPVSAWQAASPNADVLFKVVGSVETTAQIAAIEAAKGDFIISTQIDNASGKRSSPYRSGEEVAQAIIIDLLTIGTSNNRALLATVDANRKMIIYEEPTKPNAGDADTVLKRDGKLTNKYGAPIRSETCPHGMWADLEPLLTTDNNDLTQLTPMFIQESEYDVKNKRLRVIGRNRKSAFDLLSLRL